MYYQKSSRQLADMFAERGTRTEPNHGYQVMRITAKQANWLFSVLERKHREPARRVHGYRYEQGDGFDVREWKGGAAVVTFWGHA